jgi:hypothetical protein
MCLSASALLSNCEAAIILLEAWMLVAGGR